MGENAPSPYATTIRSGDHPLAKSRAQILSHMRIELTERCNQNCIHCYINVPEDGPEKARELSTGELKKVLDEAASLGCMSVKFTGGEPLLRDDFEELYLYARRLGMSVLIMTNATLITQRLASIFKKIPSPGPVMITVYGMSEETYETVTRTPGSFEAFKKGVSLLAENRVPFELNFMVTPYNIQDIDAYEFWIKGVPCVNKTPSYDIFIDLRGRREPDKNKVIKRLRMSPEDVVSLSKRSGDRYMEGIKAFSSRFMHPGGDKLFNCGACAGLCALDAYGYLQPCLQVRHPDTIYDLKNGSIRDAMTVFFPLVRKTLAKNEEYLARCSHCFLKGLCLQCPAKSWMEHGTLDTPAEYYCQVAHAQACDLGLIKDGENAWEVREWKDRLSGFNGVDHLKNGVITHE